MEKKSSIKSSKKKAEKNVNFISKKCQDITSRVSTPIGKSDPFYNVYKGLAGHYKNVLINYWQNAIREIENKNYDFKVHHLPLARIKKVMKTDEDVKMISTEAPILFAKGCDIFITELTLRAWIHAEEDKRRTLQKSDIANAISKSDMFDFLLDIISKEDLENNSNPETSTKDNSELNVIPKIQDLPMDNKNNESSKISPHEMSDDLLNIKNHTHASQAQMYILEQPSYMNRIYDSHQLHNIVNLPSNLQNKISQNTVQGHQYKLEININNMPIK